MNEDLIKNAPLRAMRNRKGLLGPCGCYNCLETYDVSEIKEWTDMSETAICPKCNVDSVLDLVDPELLKAMHNYWMSSPAEK